MRNLLLLILLSAAACSSPRYTYYFSEPSHPSAISPLTNGSGNYSASNEVIPEPTIEQKTTPPTVDVIADLPKISAEDVKKLTRAEKKQIRSQLKEVLRSHRANVNSEVGPVNQKTKQERNPKNNGFAIAGFVLSIVGWFVLWPLVILGVIFSAIGLNSERRGLATAGLILGIVGIVLVLVAANSVSSL